MATTPKQELITTLDAMWKALEIRDGGALTGLRLAQLTALVDYARTLAPKVGEMAKPRKGKGGAA